MATFEYRAATKGGKMTLGRLEGESIQHVASLLREKDLYPVEVKPYVEKLNFDLGKPRAAAKAGKEGVENKKIPLKVLTLFCRQFSVMINAGLALMPAISILLKQCEHPRFGRVLLDMRQKLESGESISQAMSHHPKVFPPIMVSMIEAGETGGVMDKVLERVAEHFEKEKALMSKVKSAMTYPMITIIVAIGVTAALIMFVLPMFAQMFEGSGVSLPWITSFLLGVADALKRYWYIILPSIAGVIVAFLAYTRSPGGRRNKDSLMMRLPLFGPLTIKMLASRFSRTFSTLLSSGVPILQCLEIVGRVLSNVIATEKLQKATDLVRTGVPLGQSLEQIDLFPPMVVHMAGIGEETGAIDTLLTKVADFYDDEVDVAVKNLTSAIEPAITIFLAGVVCMILLAVFLPMSQMLQVVG